MQQLIDTSNLILFFSLPFKPIGTFNLFFNGHIALSLGSTVYQIINPYLLKTDFLFSVMPTESWLFGNGGRWVDRDPDSPSYTHVYLYKKSECVRTVVYGAGLTVSPVCIERIRSLFVDEDMRFREGTLKYHLLKANCSSLLADALADAGLIKNRVMNLLPVRLFKGFVRRNHDWVRIKSVSRFDRSRFVLHRFCYGISGFNPQKRMDRWTARFSRRSP